MSSKAEKDAAKAAATSCSVEWRGQIREYSREIHGDSFADLAKQFAEKVGGQVV